MQNFPGACPHTWLRIVQKKILLYSAIQSTFFIFLNSQIIFKMQYRTFSVVTSISMVLALTVAVLSIIGIAVTGVYPGIVVLLLVVPIPLASKFYDKNIINKSDDFKRNYYTTLIIINLLLILVVLWMTFVIVIDRVFPNL
jgi:hypothetical protein